MPVKPQESRQLSRLFAKYGVNQFLEHTHSLVTILDGEGGFLAWNESMEKVKQSLPEARRVVEFLSSPSRTLFEECLKATIRERMRKQATFEFSCENRWGDFSCLFIPLPDERVLFIAEPLFNVRDLQTMSDELDKIKRSLAAKETELQAVLAQADEVSHTDALTFLPNRKSILSDLQREVLFSDRYGSPLAISMVDIDHFKKINDTYGHVAGDEVLRKLASELRNHIRHPDVIGRYGGEEFLVLLPHSTIKAAVEQAERLRNYIQSLAIPIHEQEIRITLSLGLAQYKINEEDWQSLLNRADAALYQAKKTGRNRWAIAEEQ